MRIGATLGLILAGLLAGIAAFAQAEPTAEVLLEFMGGEVSGKVQGQGTAAVAARVTNNSDRALNGIRVEAYYSVVNMLPSEYSVWRPHEFIFEPPLGPGKSTILRFSDDNAAEYIKLRVHHCVFGAALTYNGAPAATASPLITREGVVYIAARDLMTVLGGAAKYDDAAGEIVLTRNGITLRCKAGSARVTVNGAAQTLAERVFELEGRSYVPVVEFARLFGLEAAFDAVQNLISLRD